MSDFKAKMHKIRCPLVLRPGPRWKSSSGTLAGREGVKIPPKTPPVGPSGLGLRSFFIPPKVPSCSAPLLENS